MLPKSATTRSRLKVIGKSKIKVKNHTLKPQLFLMKTWLSVVPTVVSVVSFQSSGQMVFQFWLFVLFCSFQQLSATIISFIYLTKFTFVIQVLLQVFFSFDISLNSLLDQEIFQILLSLFEICFVFFSRVSLKVLDWMNKYWQILILSIDFLKITDRNTKSNGLDNYFLRFYWSLCFCSEKVFPY